ncbi:MAG: 16S rRNA (guanine(527)-N(7))-methyltransferase RsmG [Anaerolineales bacterium]|nr:16S rRNA (guanine(527)-N(7))-methyltransferase RsmG [Anaerolineales bacterium]
MESLALEVHDLLGIDLSPSQREAFACYQDELIHWNARHNLTAIRSPEEIRIKHFLDSLSCLLVMLGTPMGAVIDVGSGAGFPGIPLKVLCPSIKLVLVESIGKKADFLRHMVRELNLEGVEVCQDRAENLAKQPAHREQYDWAVARAVARTPALMEYLLPFVRVGGSALALKGESGPAEAQQAEKAIQLLGGRLTQILPVALSGVTEERFLVMVKKIAATPENYPRRVGIPTKRPL